MSRITAHSTQGLFGRIKDERPHLDAIDDPAVLRVELSTSGCITARCGCARAWAT